MNPLSERPHLFANGMFRIKTYTGHEYDLGNGVTLAALKNGVGRFQDTKLIARPIEDMTDEEIRSLKPSDVRSEDLFTPEFIDWYRESLKDYPQDYGVSSVDFLRLLELGVYPFSQEDFGDTVIDSRTLKTTA